RIRASSGWVRCRTRTSRLRAAPQRPAGGRLSVAIRGIVARPTRLRCGRRRKRPEGFHETAPQLGHLPATQFRNLREVRHLARQHARHGLQPIARAEHAGVNLEPPRRVVAYGLERADLGVEVGVAGEALAPWKFRKLRLRHGHAARDGAEDFGAVSLDDATGHPLDLAEQLKRAGRESRDFEQHVVAYDAERGLVERPGEVVPPRDQLAQYRQLAAGQIPRALYAQERGVWLRGLPSRALQPLKLLFGPCPALLPAEFVGQPVTQLEQMHRILRRVLQHSRRERAHGPVGTLVFLVELHVEI